MYIYIKKITENGEITDCTTFGESAECRYLGLSEEDVIKCPDDFSVEKYLLIGDNFVVNPNYTGPTPTTEEKLTAAEEQIQLLQECVLEMSMYVYQ